MLLSACMIVKDEEGMLGKTLPVLSSCVDEVILVDTGSSDNTVQIARDNGARVYHFPWINDFAAARNESIKHAKGEWILWIDADEAIKKEEFIKLREFLKDAKEDAYCIKLSECEPDKFEGHSFYFRVKLFRNNRGMYFERPINEHLVDQTGRIVSGSLINCASIYHWGTYKRKELLEKKRKRNISMLKAALENNPSDQYYHYLLATNYRKADLIEEAIQEYHKAIELDKDNQFSSSACVYLGWCYYNSKKPKEAYKAAMEALKINPEEVAAYNILGALMMACMHPKEAIDYFKKAETVKPASDVLKSVDITLTKYLANYLMGEAYLKLDQREDALVSFKKAFELDQTEQVKQKLEELKWE